MLWPKKPHAGVPDARREALQVRAGLYLSFMRVVVRDIPGNENLIMIADVNDLPGQHKAAPIFAFQKHVSANHLLLPDVDLLFGNWHRSAQDHIPYEEKSVTAGFVGASTGGGSFDAETLEQVPRLRVAAYFENSERVWFRIAKVTRCSPEARKLLERKPYFCKPVPWREQLRHRFLLSLDGNGATCSRVVRSLRSNGVLIKFASPHTLYYLPLLVAGRDYLEVKDETEVEPILDREVASPNLHKPIAEQGRAFAARYLTMQAALDYTALLLRRYLALLA